MKLVSIIMTCHNGERYLKDAVLSILTQTYKNWELIFIDNNSTDDSKNIILSFDDKRINYFKSEKTLNLGSVRNFAISKCNGYFISFLDVDDLWLDNKLDLQVKKFLSNEKIDILYSNYFQLKNNKNIKIEKNLFKGYCQRDIILSYINGKPLTAWLTLMIKKKSIEDLEYVFDENLHIASDFDLIIRLSANCYFEFLEDYICKYRIHDANESKKSYKEIYEISYIINKYKDEKKLRKIFSTNFFSIKIFCKEFFYKINSLIKSKK